jgi:hypothetical protein
MHILSRHSNEAHHSSCHEVRDRVARVGAGQTRPNRGIQQFRKIDHGQERGRGGVEFLRESGRIHFLSLSVGNGVILGRFNFP